VFAIADTKTQQENESLVKQLALLVLDRNCTVFLTKNKHKDQHKTFFEHRYIHALAKSATAERIELPSLSGRVRNFTADLSASAVLVFIRSNPIWKDVLTK